MNANCYKIIFSKHLGTLVAVGEHTSSTGKAASGQGCRGRVVADGFVGVLRFTLASVAMACLSLGNTQAQSSQTTLAANALPQGGSVSVGSASISTQGAAMAITQTTDKASINWQSFNVGTGASVNIAQPSASSVLLNRVVGNDPSQILGQLKANGQVILLNPNGVVFGKDGSVTASSFTASTFGLTDADFMAGYYKYARNGSTAAVVNQGTIETSAGGFVALIGASVNNEGTIRAPQGDVVLASAESVTLPTELVKPQPAASPGTVSVRMSKRVRLELDPAAINTAVNNTESGVILTEGGQVLLQAAAISSAVASVTHNGRIDTSAAQAGAVTVLADGGVIKVDGSIKANSNGHNGQGQANKGGDIIIGRDTESGVLAKSTDVSGAKLESQGGFVETSAHQLTVDGATVKAANWLLDPDNIDITGDATAATAGYSKIKASDIAIALNAGTSVTVATTTTNQSNQPAYKDAAGTGTGSAVSGDGNILVNAAIVKSGANNASLTLSADNGITVNQGIGKASGDTTSAGKLDITMTALGTGATSKGIYLNGPYIDAGTGNVSITGNASNTDGVYITGATNIKGNNIAINGTTSTTATNTANGINFAVLSGNPLVVNATNDLSLVGNFSGQGNGSAIKSSANYSFDPGPALLMTAGGKANITGIQAGNTSNTRGAVYFSAMRLNAVGDISMQAQAASSNSIAIGLIREAGALRTYDDWRMQVRSSTGNVLIQSNQGAVLGQDLNGGVNISGKNVTLDNTGAGMSASMSVGGVSKGSIDSTTGAIVLGDGTSTYSAIVSNGWAGNWVPLGVSLAQSSSTSNITATGNLTIGGSSSVTQGLVVGNGMSAGGNINLASRTSAASTNGLDITQAMTAGGSINLTGESTNATPGVGLNIGAEVKTTGANSTTTLTSTTGSVSGTGNITSAVGNTGTITVNAATAGTLSGVISGGGSLVKQGAGTTSLTGTNTYTGTTTISAGTLRIGNGGTIGTLGSGAVSVALGSNLNFYRSNALTAGNAISGAGTINFLGTGVQGQSDYALSGNNATFSGAITASSARLTVSNPNQVGTAGITVNSGGGLVYTHSSLTLSNALSLAGNGWNESTGYLGALRLQNGANFGGAITLTADARIGAHNDNGTVSGVISGSYNLEFNTPAGYSNSLVYLTNTNTYTGTTTVNVGTLQVGKSGATGVLGATSGVTLVGGSTLAFNKNVDTTIDKNISGNGNVTANITGNLTLTSAIALTGTNTINLTASGAITETAGSLGATNLYMTATNGGIGTSGHRIQSNVTNLSFSGGSDVFVTEANAVTVSGRTTANNGSIDVATTNGTLTVNAVNSISGITANGTGNITLTGNATSGNGISIRNVITASNGDVNLTGTTASTTNTDAGVYSTNTVTAKNITMVASATATTGAELGYYGAGGNFDASQLLSLTGTTNSSANGLYSYRGRYASGTGMTLVGNSSNGQAMGFDAGATVTNSTSGGISMTGTATDSTQMAIGMNGVTITNGGGDLAITANNGQILTGAGSLVWGYGAQTNTITNNGTGSVQITAGNGSATNSGSIDGSVFTITQNGNAGVVVSTSGTGNITAPKIINAGTGDIVVAAGTSIAGGTATGGQVLTVTDNTLTQTNAAPGKTYVYSGSADATGALSKLSTSFNSLYYEGTSQALNTGFNTAFDSNHANDLAAPTGGSVGNTQAFFRSTSMPGFTLALNSLNKAYGDSDPTLSTTSAATLTNAVAGIGGSNTFAVTTADVMAGLSRATGENVGSYAYSWSGSNFNTTVTGGFPSLTIGQRDITLATLTAANRSYDGTTNASITGATFGNIANGETLGLTGSGTFDTQNFGSGKTVTVSDVTALTHSSSGTGLWANYHLTTTGSKTTTANISQAALVVTATQVTKEYDGTTTATGTGTVATLAGAGAGELVNNAGVQVFTNPNAGAGNKTVQASGVTIKDAANNDVTANYNISYTDNTTSTITPAPLTIKVNNTAMFVTQDARAALDQGFTYTGFKNGETVATAITGSGLTPADRTYTGASNFPVAGSYTGVYGASAPNSVNGNYAITMQTGNLTVVPADKLLITIASQTDTYSNRTANNAGYVSGNNVTAQYCFVASNCAGANLVNLTVTRQSGNQWKAADNTGSFVVFDTTLLTPSYSTGGFVQAGNYTFSASEITPLSLPNGNFTGRYTNGGVLNIAPLAATLSTNGITKTYDGTTAVSAVAISPSNLAAGDVVSANASTGSFASKDAANGILLSLSNLSLAGTDAANYYLSSNSLVGTGDITPKAITLTGTSVANKQYDGNTNATILTAGNLSGLVGSETLTLNGLSGTFSSPTVGFNKAVTLAATLQNGTNGGLAGNYTLGASTAYADITQVKGKDPSPIVVPPKPIIPTDNSSEGGGSGGGSSAGNPYLVLPNNRPNSADSCTPNTLEDCLCETQEPRPVEGIAICYQPKKTANTTPAKARRG